MPITLTVAADLLAALRARSESEGRPIHAVLNDVVRRGLAERDAPPDTQTPGYTIGLLPERPGEPRPTNELVWQLLAEDE